MRVLLAGSTMALLSLPAFAPAGVSAQSLPAQPVPERLPGAVEPGRSTLPAPLQQTRPPEAKLQFSIPTQRKAPGRTGPELKFTLSRIVVDGASVVGPDYYDPLIQPLLGRPVTLSEVTALADAIQARYLALGYVLSRAFVPAQELADGTLRIQVIEGFISRVAVDGVSPDMRDRIQARLAPALAGRPARVEPVERGLLLADDLPGIALSGLLRPGEQFGAAELLVETRQTDFAGVAGLGNRNSRYAGPWTAYVDLAGNDLAGLGEQLGLTLSGTPTNDEQRALNARYLQPLTPDGDALTTTASYAKGAPGASLKPFAVSTRSSSVGQRYAYPLLRARQRNLSVEAGWSVNRAKVDILNSPYTLDRWRSVDARLTYADATLPLGGVYLSAGIVQGLDILDASDGRIRAGRTADPTSRPGAKPGFTKLTAEIEQTARLADGLLLVLEAAGQYSRDTLVAGEEFSAGGSRFGRGYNAGDLAGPKGLGLSAELRYAPLIDGPVLRSTTFYAFTDWARVWGSVALDARLASAGGGVRLGLPAGISLTAEVAEPLDSLPLPGLADPGTRYFLELSIQF